MRFLHPATLTLGVLVWIELGWALLEPTGTALLLHRVCVVLVAVTALALTYRALGNLAATNWRQPCRDFGNCLTFVAWRCLMLLMCFRWWIITRTGK